MYNVQKQQDYKRNYQNIIQRLCSNYYVGNSFDFAYRKPSSLIVKKEDLLTQKKIIQLCDYLNINDFKKIKTIKTERSFDPTFSYINRDNQDKQYEFYISNKKGKAIVIIVILNHNIIKILDNEYHQVHYYQSQNINYEKLNIKKAAAKIIIVINTAALLHFWALVIFMNSKKSYPNEISGV